MLLSISKNLKGVPHPKEEQCPVDWSVLTNKMIKDDEKHLN